MAYWRQVEQALASRPALELHASSVSAPFLQGEVAEFISSTLVTDVIRQATRARQEGLDEVAPVVTGPVDLLAATVDYVRRRGRWMEETVSLELIGVAPLERELVTLRRAVIDRLERGLEAAAS
jgi:hypothetical protein